ncbi:MAG: 50S ribosomal protein L11 methyltransferase [Chryseolinea sp.]
MFHTRLRVVCESGFSELLIAEIAEVGFDSFLETDDGFEAYAEMENFNREALQHIKEKYEVQTTLAFHEDKIQKQNWNELWEKSYHAIVVDDRCLIRAEFHKIEETYPYELIITPKMSFGTGHHQTTYLMIKNQMDIDHRNKQVMDAGCGTAILSVMASMLGAKKIEAFDIDEWSITNSMDNIALNHCTNIHHQHGKLSELHFLEPFDIILANINKNVLLDEIKLYSDHLVPEGELLMSGFYTHDIADLAKAAERYGLFEKRRDEREGWACVVFVKAARE